MTSAGIAGRDRRSRQREQRRETVYRTATRLFVERGYENVTMEEIAEAADVARATVFNHFPRKAEFLAEWALRRREHARAAVSGHDRTGHSLLTVVTDYFRALGNINAGSRDETMALLKPAMQIFYGTSELELSAELGAFVLEAQRRGDLKPEVHALRVGFVLASVYLATVSKWVSSEPEPFYLPDELHAVADMVLTGAVRLR